MEIIQAPKIEAVIKRIWNSSYDTSGSFFEMSTPYRILTNSSSLEDTEEKTRFYKWRDIEKVPQNDSNFTIFQKSMYARWKAGGVILTLYVILSALLSNMFYASLINLVDNLYMCGFTKSYIMPEPMAKSLLLEDINVAYPNN